jgi:hypothetical protein
MGHTFCTIITASHLPWAIALTRSLRDSGSKAGMSILVVDAGNDTQVTEQGVELVTLEEMRRSDLGRRICDRYATLPDALRWSLKPVLMMHLLDRYDKLIYLDWDLHFYNDPGFLWNELDGSSILLSPHWRSSRVSIDLPNFEALLVGGLFNAGFVGANRGGIPALLHWGENCFDLCIKDFTRAMCDDQHYLNLLPVYFEKVGILRHRGCNLANWNMVECVRTIGKGGEVLINDVYPVIFVHFTRSTILGILKGRDPLLHPHLQMLADRLEQIAPGTGLIAKYQERIQAGVERPTTIDRILKGMGLKKTTS